MLARVLLKRLISTMSENLTPETECRFRANRSNVNMIFSLRQLIEESREQHRPLFTAFVHLSKAIDYVAGELMWLILERCGCLPRFVKLMQKLHEGMSLQIKLEGNLSDPFTVTR